MHFRYVYIIRTKVLFKSFPYFQSISIQEI